jgi:hypothetical protein
MLDPKHTDFRSWAEERGVEIDGLRVAKLAGKGIGVVASRKLRVIPISYDYAELLVLTKS